MTGQLSKEGRPLRGAAAGGVGVVLPAAGQVSEGGFFGECLTGVCRTLEDTEYDAVVFMDAGKLARAEEQGRLAGALAAAAVMDGPAGRLLRERDLPFVVVGPSAGEDDLRVDYDQRSACRKFTALLLERYQNLVLVGGEAGSAVTRERVDGFVDACRAAGRPPREVGLRFRTEDRESAAQALETALTDGADCLVCADDLVCACILSLLHSRGWRVPEDIGVASLRDSGSLRSCAPPITGLCFDGAELWAAACRMLLDRLKGLPTPSPQWVGYQIDLRASTR